MPDPKWDHIWTNARLATMHAERADPLGVVDGGALAVANGRIAWVGPLEDLGGDPVSLAAEVHDVGGRWILPGFVDCHTHLVWAGSRADEFEQRLRGASYAEIARAGGGILSTVRSVREADVEALVRASLPRLDLLLQEGVTTVEIKSGYGLSVEAELRMLRAARSLSGARPVRVVPTLLAAHAVPPEYDGRADAFIDHVIDNLLPDCREAGLSDVVDAFCETIAFTPRQVDRLFEASREQGYRVRLHADQLSDSGGAALAARHQALSADHLEYVSDPGIEAMAKANTVAVLLPAAFYTLGETRRPPVGRMREHGVAMAVATDCNPGTAPTASILLAANMACTLFGLTTDEALRGITVHAAEALGLDDCGVLAPGRRADFAVWNVERPAELCYWIGGGLPETVVVEGKPR